MQIVKVIEVEVTYDVKDIENEINSVIADMQGMRLADIRQLGDSSLDGLYIILTFEK